MDKKRWMIVVAFAAVAVLAACTPTGGEPENAADTNSAESTGDEPRNTEMEPAALEGVRWILASYMNAAGETVDTLAGSEVTAEFGLEPGRMGGSSGCNTYSAGYAVDGNTLTISEAISTLMACEPAELMQQEAEFLAALQSAATFEISGDLLTIANAAGETALTFEATEPATLTGTSWTANSYNTGQQSVSSLMANTAITANFGEDGSLNGSAGCNNYMTTYTVDGNNITIEAPASTRKMCPEPAGIMEQEAAFLSMLPQAATYSISGNVLELRTADGALIAGFNPAQ